MRLGRLVIVGALLLSLLSVGSAFFTVPPVKAAASYTVTELGHLAPLAINASGQVVGYYWPDNGEPHAFSWQNGVLSDLGTLGGRGSQAFDVNASGQVVGTADYQGDSSYSFYHAFLWNAGAMQDLGGLPEYSVGRGLSQGSGINDAGDVVGNSNDSEHVHALLWHNGTMTDLGTFGGTASFTRDINNSGQVVGAYSKTPAGSIGPLLPFLWENGRMRDLDTLPGISGGVPEAINDAGQIVGRAADNGRPGASRAVIWQEGTVRDLGMFPDSTHADAQGINSFGQVVGSSYTLNGNIVTNGRAFLWQNGTLQDLSALVGRPIQSAWGINDAGQIIASTGQAAFLLTPTVPTSQYFAPTGKAISGPFLAQWQLHGGLAINGYPISSPFMETLEDGKPYLVQYFERVRMEYHPENADPQYQVLLGQFGRKLHPAEPPATAKPGATFFEQTGHNVGPRFLDYWQTNGGLPQFGLPLSEEFTETLEDGKAYQVQYFERARFEYHPENPPPYNVLLGQFGRRILGRR